MPGFPVEARRDKVLRAFAILGFQATIKEHIHLERTNPDGTTATVTLPNHNVIQGPTLLSACRQAGIPHNDFIVAFEQA
jgi:hypothetical protein